MSTEPRDATPATVEVNRAAVAKYESGETLGTSRDARRGRIADLDPVRGQDDHVLFDTHDFDWISGDPDAIPPDTVAPSLHRQPQVLKIGGLFEVTPGVF